MRLESLSVKNFRRLKDVHITLEPDVSIFVGSNNSGKTAAVHALRLLTSPKKSLTLHDFSADCWALIDKAGDLDAHDSTGGLPSISLDLWFEVDDADLHRVIDLLPDLDWKNQLVGVRIEFCVADLSATVGEFQRLRGEAKQSIDGTSGVLAMWPKSLSDFLSRRLTRDFEFRYFVIQREGPVSKDGRHGVRVVRRVVSDSGHGGAQVISRLLKVDFLTAQRHLSDDEGGGRAEEISKQLSAFYRRNLETMGADYSAMQSLASSELQLNAHLAKVFDPTLKKISALGYPGLDNPDLVVRSTLNPEAVVNSSGGTQVHYRVPGLNASEIALPEKYNGLGFKNLVYMAVELLDIHARWEGELEGRAPVHLIFVEEPEAHLHVQLQQVFIRKVFDILGKETAGFKTQVIVTTHSPHILYERGFKPIRYFRRARSPSLVSDVVDVSRFNEDVAPGETQFLERYLKLSHCDLFFADAAILVEGNVERLLLPLMIQKAAPALQSSYLSVLEVGGAFAYRFGPLLQYLGLNALVITDLDSVCPKPTGDGKRKRSTSCQTNAAGALTSNQTLIKWLPRKQQITELLAASPDECIERGPNVSPQVRVVYQKTTKVVWKSRDAEFAGRTFEEAFALENLTWCQEQAQSTLQLLIDDPEPATPGELATALHDRIDSGPFKKTDFALSVLAAGSNAWIVPEYISDGLKWLASVILPQVHLANGPAT
jgi:predicted ATP-dependent endonuclease of OLD family